MASTKKGKKGTKTMMVTKDLQEQTKAELLKEGKSLGLFVGVTAKKLSSLPKDDMIREIMDAKAQTSGTKEIVIGEGPKKAPAKKTTKAARTKKAIPKKASPEKKSEYDSKTVSALLKECKGRGIEACIGKRVMPKAALIAVLEMWDSQNTGGVKKSPPKKASPKKGAKKTAKKPAAKKASPAKVGRSTCTSDQVLVLETGKCVKKTKTGAPYGEAALKKKYGDDYIYDEELGVVGRQAEVDSYRSEIEPKKTPSPPKKVVVPKKSSPPKKVAKKVAKKAKRCDDLEDPVICGEEQVCKANTGRCVADTAAARKGMSELKVDGRTIIGDAATIKSLQGVLGGTISSPSKPAAGKKVAKKVPKKASPKKASPKKASPKTVSEIEERLKELIGGDEGGDEVIEKLRAKLAAAKKTNVARKVPVPKKKTPPKAASPKKKTPPKAASPKKKTPPKAASPKKKTPPKAASPKRPTETKVELQKQQILETFEKCLANLQA